jgi:hypothetical protein
MQQDILPNFCWSLRVNAFKDSIICRYVFSPCNRRLYAYFVSIMLQTEIKIKLLSDDIVAAKSKE